MGGVLEGKVAIVTGGGTGIGAAIVRLFAREGCRVVVVGRRRAPVESVANEISGLAVVADISAVNLRGTALCIKHAVPLLRRTRGSIVNVSSRGVSLGKSDYVASKAALRGLTEAVAQELGPDGVRVNTLTPGTVNTEMMQETLADWSRRDGRPVAEVLQARYFARAALKRMVEPGEVVAAALFLVSDAAAAVTGAEIRVNGGRA